MQSSKLKKYKSIILFFLLVTAIFSLYILPVFLAPYIIQKKILPKLSSDGYQFSCEIRKAGYFELSVNDLSLKKDGQLILQVDNFSVDYLFYGLGGVDKVKIVGLKVETNTSKGREEKSDVFLSLSSALKGIKNFKISQFRKIPENPLFKELFADTKFIIKTGKYCIKDDSGVAKIYLFDLNFRYSVEAGLTDFRFESEAISDAFAIFASSGEDGLISLTARGSEHFPYAVEIEKGRIFFLEESLRFDIPTKIKMSMSSLATESFCLPIRISGEISDEVFSMNCSLQEKSGFSFASELAELRGNLSSFAINLELREDMNLLVSSRFEGLNLDTTWGILKVPEIDFVCEYKNGEGAFSVKFTGASYLKDALTISGISILAESKDLKRGKIIGGVSKMEFSGIDCGNIDIAGDFDLVENSLDLRGEYLLPEIRYKLPISVLCGLKGRDRFFRISAKNDDYVSLEKFSLSRYLPGLNGFFLAGDLKLNYMFEYKGGEIKSYLETVYRNFSVENAGIKMKLSGLEGKYVTCDPKLMSSLPSQFLKADRLEIGKNLFNNISLRYCLESPESFFIENLSAEWCGGFLNVFSTRIDDLKTKNIIIYFDRILLSEFLSVIGVCDGYGDGRVNGKIPLTVEGSGISFNDAFFYSSPGVGGNIKMQGRGGLAEALPNQIGAGASSVDLTLEALKDFDYDWSKITLNTDGEDIVAKIEFLGRPSKPLPFHFDRQTGNFSRVEADLPGSVFQEIKLDFNCRLPFNAIMRYIKNFGAILK